MLELAGAVALLVAFLLIQRSVREPLMPLAIWRTPGLATANLAMALLGAAWIPMRYFLNLYLQQVLGYGAFASGAALLPMTVAIMIFMIATSSGADRLGDLPRLTGGFQAAFIGAGTVTAAGAVLTVLLMRQPKPAVTGQDIRPEAVRT
ncbi:hypothetical protein [Planomonospora sp. ID67723]|uniref:hypothetical protein n=1 Tax=Planomonospora sp. ID67723 TaxID=2738134 RepID=UPI001E5ED77E|nr:hypothetical protein [Planomonospora sp. ID67723]